VTCGEGHAGRMPTVARTPRRRPPGRRHETVDLSRRDGARRGGIGRRGAVRDRRGRGVYCHRSEFRGTPRNGFPGVRNGKAQASLLLPKATSRGFTEFAVWDGYLTRDEKPARGERPRSRVENVGREPYARQTKHAAAGAGAAGGTRGAARRGDRGDGRHPDLDHGLGAGRAGGVGERGGRDHGRQAAVQAVQAACVLQAARPVDLPQAEEPVGPPPALPQAQSPSRQVPGLPAGPPLWPPWQIPQLPQI